MSSVLILMGMLTASAAPVAPTTAGAPGYGSDYATVKSWDIRQRPVRGLSGSESLARLRDLTRAAFGERGLRSAFKNFEGTHRIDARLPGVLDTARLMSSDNPNVAKGALRTMLNAASGKNSVFGLTALNRPERLGSRLVTDHDMVYRSRLTGRELRVEVKHVKPESQRSNLAKYKVQVDKMAAHAARTNTHQAFVSRFEVVPELKSYARSRNIDVFERVTAGDERRVARPVATPSTGDASAPRTKSAPTMHFNDVLRTMAAKDRMLAKAAIRHGARAGGAAGAGMSLWSTYSGVKTLIAATESGSIREGVNAALHLGSAAAFGANAVVTARTAIQQTRSLSVLGRTGAARVLPGVGYALMAGGMVVDTVAFIRGEMTSRQYWTGTAGTVGGLAGAAAGGWAGAKVGAFVGAVGGPIGIKIGFFAGGVVGGVAGAFGVEWAVSESVDKLVFEPQYRLKDIAQEKELIRFLVDHYSKP